MQLHMVHLNNNDMMMMMMMMMMMIYMCIQEPYIHAVQEDSSTEHTLIHMYMHNIIAIYTELDRTCCVCVLDARCCMLIIASRCHVLVSCAGVCREMAAAAQSVCSWRSTHPPDPLACSRPDCLQTTCCS